MKSNVTEVMVEEHRLILRMIALVEHNTARLEAGRFDDWQFYLDAVDFIRNYLFAPYRTYRKLVFL